MDGRLDGLERSAWNNPYGAQAFCDEPLQPPCGWEAAGVSPETAAAKARDHTRETGHATRVHNHRITEYRRA